MTLSQKAVRPIGALAVAFLTIIGGLSATAAAQADPIPEITVGPAELLYSDAQLPIYFDGSMATLRQSPTSTTFWHSIPTQRFVGPDNAPLASGLGNTPVNMNGFSGEAWLTNVYEVPNGGGNTLLGFAHREADPGVPSGNFFLGLMWSTNRGASWTYLGDTVAPKVNGAFNKNIGAVPYLVVGDYFYVYFNEHVSGGIRRLSVARASVADVIAAAANGQLTAWTKYGAGGWNQDSFTGTATNIIPNGEQLEANEDYAPDFHSDATYSRALGKFLITVQTEAIGKLLMYSSSDGINWGQETLIDETSDNNFNQPYSFFLGLSDSTNDSREVGSQFYIYFPRKDGQNNYFYDEFYRRLITVGTPVQSASTVNDTGSAFAYSGGSWGYDTNRGLGDYQNDVHYASANNDEFTATFSGTGVTFVGEKGSDQGDVDVYVDSVFKGTVSTFASSKQVQQDIYSIANLASGSHTIRVVKKSGSYMTVDAITVTP